MSEYTREDNVSALALIFFKSPGGQHGDCLSLRSAPQPKKHGEVTSADPGWWLQDGTMSRLEVTWYLVSPPPPVSWSRHGVGLGEKLLLLSGQVRGGCQAPLGKAYTHAAMCMCVRTAHVHTRLCAQTMPCTEGGEDCALFSALFPLLEQCLVHRRCWLSVCPMMTKWMIK